MRTLLDYGGDPEEPVNDLSFQGVKNYWIKHKREESGLDYQWSAKDQTLLSRLMKEYPKDKFILMMDFYLQRKTGSFGAFYKSREAIYQQLFKPENYGFD